MDIVNMVKENRIDWEIESIRTTAFINNPMNPNMLESWLTMVCENQPTQVSKAPSSFVGISINSAGVLRASWAANRFDLLLSSEDPKSNKTISHLSESTHLFNQFFDRISEIGELPVIDRFALGMVLTMQVENDAEGLKALKPFIIGIDVPESATDFLYRINIPCKSKSIEDKYINRLTTWSVSHPQLIELQLRSDGLQTQQVISEDPVVIRLELDINTDKNVNIGVHKDSLNVLLEELKSIVLTIANQGEISMR